MRTSSPVRGLGRPSVAAPAIAIFVLFGLPDGLLGAAWPAIRADLGLPVAALGVLLVSNTAGFLLTSAANGGLAGRAGPRMAVLAAAAVTLAGSLTVAASRGLAPLAVGVLVLGACGGVLDPTLSTLASLQRRHRLLNLMHGGYGLGAALAPLLVTAAVALGSWRGAYLALAAGQAAICAWWGRATGPAVAGVSGRLPAARETTAPGWPAPGPAPAHRAGVRGSGWRPAVMGVVAFFFVSGLEIAIGAWAATYLRGALRLPAALTGFGVFAYWASLTASRIAAGVLPHRRGPRELALAGSVAALAGAAMLWWGPDGAVAIAGLIVAGTGTGLVFPALTSLTPARVGPSLASRVIGWQLAAGAVGAAVLSSLIGVGLQRAGLAMAGPLLTGLALVAGAATVSLDWMARPAAMARVGG
jgi:fucose permease